MKTAFIDLGDYIFSMEIKESREELIKRLGTREDGRFPLWNIEKLEELIKAGNDKSNWHCLGREFEKEGIFISDCKYAYTKNPGCTKDCKFYKEFHRTNLQKIIDYFRNIIPKAL